MEANVSVTPALPSELVTLIAAQLEAAYVAARAPHATAWPGLRRLLLVSRAWRAGAEAHLLEHVHSLLLALDLGDHATLPPALALRPRALPTTSCRECVALARALAADGAAHDAAATAAVRSLLLRHVPRHPCHPRHAALRQ